MKLHTLKYSNPLSAILEDFLSIRFKPHQVVERVKELKIGNLKNKALLNIAEHCLISLSMHWKIRLMKTSIFIYKKIILQTKIVNENEKYRSFNNF